ncbi:MAG: transglutaminase domain-containing protein [Methanobrevibacter sp.]|nr:transglutaminase domain-containing protein [Methanobrevibacter sp.]
MVEIILRKRMLFVLFLALILVFSISAITANDSNMTDLSVLNSSDDSIQIGNAAQAEPIISDNTPTDDYSNESSLNKTEFASPTTSVYYKGFYNVTLKDSNDTLPNKTVTFTINKVNYTAVTDSNGVASINLELTPGKYTASAYFAGDETYESSSLTTSFEVLSTIKASNLSKYYKGSTKYTATLFDSYGNALANGNVTITVNGKSYTKKTNSKGEVSLAVNLKPGTYKIVSADPITGYKVTTTFKILPTITSKNIKKVAGSGRKFSAKFFKGNGKALANRYVKFKVKGKIYKVKTNSNGKAGLALKQLKKGKYKVICYNPDGFSKSYTVQIFKRKASTKLTSSFYTFLPNDDKVIRVKYSTALNDNSNVGRIIKIKINGKTYSKKTDSEGIASLSLKSFKKGLYTVEYSYGGTYYFKAAKTKNLVTIIDNASDTKLTVKSTKTFGYGAGTPFKVAFTAGGVPLPKRTMTFKVNGETYTQTTDNKGIAEVPINLNLGNYTITYKTNTKFKVNGTSGSCDIKVVKRDPSKVVWKCGKSYKDNLQTFKVLVTDANGKAVFGGDIELTIDGETFYSTVRSNGYATFKTEAPIGKYKVSVKFCGNNEFLPSSTSKSVNVKLSKFGNGLNQKNAASLKAYLRSSWHCKVGSPAIKSLVKSLTSGLTNKVDKAKAIFNYVRDNLDYSYYYDTKYGASKTLKLKKGNCVDHSHLLVAMFRTAGFQARYVHGVCHFIKSGDTTGHVWTQVKIGKTWVCADAISYGNDLGRIKNWNTKSYHVYGKYSSLPF